MGLDMYLYRETYVKNWDYITEDDPAAKFVVRIEQEGRYAGANIDPDLVTYIGEEVGYWRKANAIHAWFINNCAGGVDECQRVFVSRVELAALRDLCSDLLARKNPSEAARLLPVRSGFFFGSTEYDEWYWDVLTRTIEILDLALSLGEHGEFYYQASW